jgi:hypothetical protein
MTKQIYDSKKAMISLAVFAVLILSLGFTRSVIDQNNHLTEPQKHNSRQAYHPFIDIGKHWNVMHEGFEVKRTVEYYISAQDTTINDTVYRKVLVNEQYGYYPSGIAGFIREDTAERRVYFRSYYGWNHPIKDRLLYDFSIDEGDTLDVYGLYCETESNTFKVTSKSTIELLNGEHRTIWDLHHLYDPYQEPDQWIEGMGSLNGVLFPFCSEIGIISAYVELLCHFEDDVKLYMSAQDTCFVDWTTGVQANMQHNIQLYPNPVTNVLYLTTHGDSERFNAYEIYNLSGLKVAEGRLFNNSYAIPVDYLGSGMYLLRIKNELNAQNFKFIKK